jgi:hypothetical protein
MNANDLARTSIARRLIPQAGIFIGQVTESIASDGTASVKS